VDARRRMDDLPAKELIELITNQFAVNGAVQPGRKVYPLQNSLRRSS
jgi:hypothetical protein